MDDGRVPPLAERIAALVDDLAAVPDAGARGRAEELVRLLMELYGAGIARILEIVDESGSGADDLFARFGGDPLVSCLLLLHGLHPASTEARVRASLDRVCTALGAPPTAIVLLGAENGIVTVELSGDIHEYGSPAATLRPLIERAIEEAAPEVLRVEIEGEPAAGPPSLVPLARAPIGRPIVRSSIAASPT